jgi:hypothetical protein
MIGDGQTGHATCSVMQDIEIVVTPHDEKRELNCVVSAVGHIEVDGCHAYRHLRKKISHLGDKEQGVPLFGLCHKIFGRVFTCVVSF